MEQGGESVLAQCMLSVVQAETLLASNESSLGENVERQKPLLALLAQVSAKYVECAAEAARAKVLGHFLRSCIRAFNRLGLQSRPWSREQSQQLLSLLCGMEPVLRETGSRCGPTVAEGAMDDIVNILYPLLVTLDRLKEHAEGGDFHASDEELAEHAISAMLAILLLNNTLTAGSLQQLAAKTATIWAQMAYVLVALSKVKVRKVCMLSISCLLHLLSLARHDTAFVRSVFPGVFSAMYRVCTSSQNRGSNILREAVLVLLRLMEITTNDAAEDNTKLLIFLSASSHSASQDRTHSGNSSSAVFAAFVAARAAPSIAAAEPVGEFPTMDAFQQYRVALLQRIRDHFPVAFSTALSNLSAKHKQALSEALAAVLQNCHVFLGSQACEDLLLCLLRSGGHASNFSTVQLAQDTLERMTQSSGALASSLLSNLNDRYIAQLTQLEGLVTSANETLARQKLEELVCLGGLLQDQLRVNLLANRPLVIQTLLSITAVDLTDKHSALETSRYTYFPADAIQGRVAFCMGSYYLHRPSYLHDRECQSLLRRLIVQVACFSDLLGFCLELQQRVDMLTERLFHPRRRARALEHLKRSISQTAAMLQIVRFAFFAGRSYTFVEEIPVHTPAECVVCGDHKAPLRCSRCKLVVYCSKEHQQAHWPSHKQQCKPTVMSKEHGAAAVHIASSKTAKRIHVDKYIDPHDILHGEGLVSVSSNEQHRQFHQALSILSQQLDRLLQICLWTNSMRAPSLVLEGSVETTGEGGRAGVSVEVAQQLFRLLAVAIQSHADAQWLYYLDNPRPASQVSDLLVLIQCAVVDNGVVQQAAKASLERIAHYAGFAGLPAMLSSQMDYFVDWVCQALRSWSTPYLSSLATPSFSSSASRMRSSWSSVSQSPVDAHAMVRYVFVTCSIQLDGSAQTPMYLLKDIIRDVLDAADLQSTSPRIHLNDLIQLLKVIHAFAVCIPIPRDCPLLSNKRWKAMEHLLQDPSTGKMETHIADSSPLSLTSSSGPTQVSIGAVIASSILTFQQNVTKVFVAESSVDQSDHHDNGEGTGSPGVDGGENDQEGEAGEEEKALDPDEAPMTPSIQLLLDIVSRARYLLALENLQLQQMVLSILGNALLRLAGNDKYLLPTIHQVWTVVAHRLHLQTAWFLQRSLLQQASQSANQPARSARQRLELEQKDPSVASKLLLLTRQAEHGLSSSTSSAAPASRTSSHSQVSSMSESQMGSSVSSLYLLPSLLDLVTWMTCLSPGFVTHKLKEDCLPRVLAILFGIQDQYLNTSPAQGKPADGSDYTLDAKIRLAVLSFIEQLLDQPRLARMLRSHYRTFLWLLLPLCCASTESQAVASQAQRLYGRFEACDPVFADMLIQKIADLHGCSETQREMVITHWSMLALDPQIMQAYQAAHNIVQVPSRFGRSSDAGPPHFFAMCKSYRNHCVALVHRFATDRVLNTWIRAKHSQRNDGIVSADSWSPSTIETVQNRARV